METYDRDNEYDTLMRMFRFVRDYHPSTYSLPMVCRLLVEHMNNGGYDAILLDDNARDYRIVQVDDRKYKIIRNHGWSYYEVRMTATA